MNIQGSIRELTAMTDHDEDIATGSVIKVCDVIDGEILLVDKV